MNASGEIHPVCRVAIVEDHVLQRAGTEVLLKQAGRFDIVFSGSTLPEFVGWVQNAPREQRPHLLILDLIVDREASASPAVIAALTRAGLRVVVLSALASPPLVRAAIHAGVGAVVSKHDAEEDILAAIDAVLRGEDWMTPVLAAVIAGDPDRPTLSLQEERALILYASGLLVDQVSAAMGIKRDTTKQYLARVKKKYAEVGVPIRSHLDYAKVALAEGYISLSLPAFPDAQNKDQ